MLLISCPHCGPRDEVEFRCGGEAHLTRPGPPDTVSDDIWAGYLFMRRNPRGLHYERWLHAAGCRTWFNVARDTVTHEIKVVYAMGQPRPECT
ncbi:sarcosine oxidase subunit delta [Nitrospirillum sp. BR 11163]|uniref:sarcosine oxidase subunit delta n=1 Tax=Nitrospirillum sp. BR 11163 TaxID=3104323 RepID=UPI002AFE214F|nr:sarcosine oxidase subunit delta [Nitrospirillum sp. BR 11163]MEA1672717.1 sarcosine oxidase subunit delta [Nitrospirillum sp. BR 11163]